MDKKIVFFTLLVCMVGMQVSTPLFAMSRSSKSVNFSGFINQSNLQNDMDSDVGLDYEADDELSKLGDSLSRSCSVTPHDSRSGSVQTLISRSASSYIRPISAMSFRSNSTATTHADDVSPMQVEDDLLRSDSVMSSNSTTANRHDSPIKVEARRVGKIIKNARYAHYKMMEPSVVELQKKRNRK